MTDCAAGRSLKAHNDYEPVLSPQADLVIAVIGSDCLGCPLSDTHVHRAARFSQLLNRPLGTPVTVEDVTAIFFHPLGYLKTVPPEAEVIVLLTKAADVARRASAACGGRPPTHRAHRDRRTRRAAPLPRPCPSRKLRPRCAARTYALRLPLPDRLRLHLTEPPMKRSPGRRARYRHPAPHVPSPTCGAGAGLWEVEEADLRQPEAD